MGTAGHARPSVNCHFVSVFAEEEGGDLAQPGLSFPGPTEEDLGRVQMPRGPPRIPPGTLAMTGP